VGGRGRALRNSSANIPLGRPPVGVIQDAVGPSRRFAWTHPPRSVWVGAKMTQQSRENQRWGPTTFRPWAITAGVPAAEARPRA